MRAPGSAPPPTKRDARSDVSASGATNAPATSIAEALPRDDVGDAHEHRRDAHREVDALDRAHAEHERRDDDVRGVERRADADEARAERRRRRPCRERGSAGTATDAATYVARRSGTKRTLAKVSFTAVRLS